MNRFRGNANYINMRKPSFKNISQEVIQLSKQTASLISYLFTVWKGHAPFKRVLFQNLTVDFNY